MPKNRVFWHLKNWEFTKCSKFRELSVKRKQAKDGKILCLLQSTFSKQKQDRAITFSDYCVFVTALIPVSARTHPSSAEPPTEIRLWMLAVRACRKFLHPLFQTVRAEPFTLMWERVWVLFRTTQRFQSTHICLFRLIRCVRADQCCRNADFQVCSRFSLLSKPNTISQSVWQVRHFSK